MLHGHAGTDQVDEGGGGVAFARTTYTLSLSLLSCTVGDYDDDNVRGCWLFGCRPPGAVSFGRFLDGK